MDQIAIFLGSKNDKAKVQGLFDIFEKFKISHFTKILSAHRVPDELVKFVKELKPQEVPFIIAIAGGVLNN